MTNEKAIMCLEDMKIKVPIPKAAKQARENNEALDVAIKALQSAEPKRIRGHWRHYEGEMECSVCGARFFDEIMDLCEDDVPHFCPDCGSCMGVTE